MPTTNQVYIDQPVVENMNDERSRQLVLSPKRGQYFIGQRVKLLKPKYLQGKLATIAYIGNYYSQAHGYRKSAQLDIDGLGRYRKSTGTAFMYPLSYLKIISGFGSFGAWAKAKKEEGLNV